METSSTASFVLPFVLLNSEDIEMDSYQMEEDGVFPSLFEKEAIRRASSSREEFLHLLEKVSRGDSALARLSAEYNYESETGDSIAIKLLNKPEGYFHFEEYKLLEVSLGEGSNCIGSFGVPNLLEGIQSRFINRDGSRALPPRSVEEAKTYFRQTAEIRNQEIRAQDEREREFRG